MLPSILLDTAKMVPILVQSLLQVAPIYWGLLRDAIPGILTGFQDMLVGMIAGTKDLFTGAVAQIPDILTAVGRDFRRELIADAAALLTREGRRNKRNEEGLVKRLRGALTVDLDGRKVSRGLDQTADARKGGEGRRNG